MGTNNLAKIIKEYQREQKYNGRKGVTIGEIKHELALHLEISFHSVHSIYQNTYLPRAVECLKLCNYFGVTIQELINE